MNDSARYIWLDGTLMNSDEATVPVMNASLHYGLAIFEGIRCYDAAAGPAVFRLREHMERLLASAHVLGLHGLACDVDDLVTGAREVVRANEFTSCYIRPVIYLGEGGWNMTVDSGVPHVAIGARPWTDFLPADSITRGIRAHVSSFTRHHPNIAMTKAKVAGNYTNSVLARTEALRLGFDEAIMLDPQGYVAECTGENIFLVRHGALLSPPTATTLEGITRDSLVSLASRLGLAVHERQITRDQLYLADEVFMCGTAAEVVSVREVDHRTIGAGVAGPVTKALQSEFRAVVDGHHPLSAAWLDPVHGGLPATVANDHHVEVGYGHGV